MNPPLTSWPTFVHLGKTYARDTKWGDILVWRFASRRTGRWHWVLLSNPPAEVVAALAPDDPFYRRGRAA